MTIAPDLALIVPELMLALGLMGLLLFGAFRGDGAMGALSGLATVLLLAAGALVLRVPDGASAFAGSLVFDAFGKAMKLLVLAGAAVSLVMAQGFLLRERIARAEFPVLVLFATLGMMMMISARDLLTLYVAIELQSLALYVLAAFNRDSQRASEAGLKYFVLSALASGLLLYGMSLVYGFAGSTDYASVAARLAGGARELGILAGLVFMATGMAFKISAVPFHMWTPDVYEGAPTPVTAFLAAAPKIAAFAVLTRLVADLFASLEGDFRMILAFLAIASMAVGAFGAIGQQNIKRLMAYSTIGHVGYALVGLAAGGEAGIRAVLIYLAIYLATNLGVFAVILSMRLKEGMVEQIGALAGLATRQPALAFALLVLMFSLAGIPPMAGFFGKYYVFMAAVEAGLVPLAVIGVLASVVSAYYYLRIVKIAYFDDPAEPFERRIGGEMSLILTGATALVLGFIAFLPMVAEAARLAAQSLTGAP